MTDKSLCLVPLKETSPMLKFAFVLKSSRAAIDLASIMVGIIVIGLIGGVIAATVFAVIPWSQDKAAKQQLDSVHTAENAFFGLSSDPSQNLVGGKKNSFANSSELDSNSLLSKNTSGTYCVVPTTDGKDYHAYSKSGSGKWFYALNSNKEAKMLTTGVVPCLLSGDAVGTVDPTVDDGSGVIPTTPGTGTTPTTPAVPADVLIKNYDFENKSTTGFSALNSPRSYSFSVIPTTRPGSTSANALQFVSEADSVDTQPTIVVAIPNIEYGQKYRVTAWVYRGHKDANRTPVDFNVFGVSYNGVDGRGDPVPAVNTWTKVTYEVTAKYRGLASKKIVENNFTIINSAPAYVNSSLLVDDISIEKIG